MDFQTLDFIADLYIPLLLLISVYSLITTATRSPSLALRQFLILVSGVCIVYGIMLLDNHFLLWPKLGLDYSTHTALSLVLVVFLGFAAIEYQNYWRLSFLLYCGLMLYQNYHTLSDIITTAIVIYCLYLFPLTFKKPNNPNVET